MHLSSQITLRRETSPIDVSAPRAMKCKGLSYPVTEFRPLFAQALQVEFLCDRQVQHGDALPFPKFLQPHLAAVRETDCIAVAVDCRGYLREGYFLRRSDTRLMLQPDRNVLQQKPGPRRNAHGRHRF